MTTVSSGGTMIVPLAGHTQPPSISVLRPQLTSITGGLSADQAAMIDFMQRFRPDGPMMPCSKHPDGGRSDRFHGRFFTTDAYGNAATWAARENNDRNVYFHIAEPTEAAASLARDGKKPKLSKPNVQNVEWLWVDLDPLGDASSLPTWRQETLNKLNSFALPPTLIIDSGRGLWGFWRLAEPFEVGGDLRRVADFERYSEGLEKHFGADNCHNIDRVARFPGSVNWLSEDKRFAGFVPARAHVVSWHEDHVYELGDFEPFAVSKASPKKSATVSSVNPTTIRRLESLDDLDCLRGGKNAVLRLLIETGKRPDGEKPFRRRSHAVFSAACQLIRLGVSDEVIFGIVTDPRWAISKHDTSGPAYEKRAWSKIAEARAAVEKSDAEAETPELAELNAKHAVVQAGGKTLVASFERDPETGRDELRLSGFDDFRRRYCNRDVEVLHRGKKILLVLGNWWLRHPHRAQYDGLVLAANREVPGYLNMWRGFGVEAKSGSCPRVLDLIRDVICNGDPELYRYVVRWCAWAVQNPDKPTETALVLLGGEGTGKGTFGRLLCRLFGAHGAHIGSSDKFLGRFNDHLANKAFVFADEAINPESRGEKARLKGLITEPRITLEGKNRDVIEVTNHLKIVIASNDERVVPADAGARRFVVMEVSDARKEDRAYFKAIEDEIKRGGDAAFLDYLLRLPLGDWRPRHEAPKTVGLQRQQAANLSGFEAFIFDALSTGIVPMELEHKDGATTNPHAPGCRVSTKRLTAAAQASNRREHISLNRVASVLEKLGFQRRNDSPRGFILPPIHEARAAWDKAYFPSEWSDCDGWEDAGGVGKF